MSALSMVLNPKPNPTNGLLGSFSQLLEVQNNDVSPITFTVPVKIALVVCEGSSRASYGSDQNEPQYTHVRRQHSTTEIVDYYTLEFGLLITLPSTKEPKVTSHPSWPLFQLLQLDSFSISTFFQGKF